MPPDYIERPVKCCCCLPVKCGMIFLTILEAFTFLNISLGVKSGLEYIEEGFETTGIIYIVGLVIGQLFICVFNYHISQSCRKGDSLEGRMHLVKSCNWLLAGTCFNTIFVPVLMIVSLGQKALFAVAPFTISFAFNMIMVCWWRCSCTNYVNEKKKSLGINALHPDEKEDKANLQAYPV